jgi:hypothetical protein
LQLSCKPFTNDHIKDDLKIKYNFMSGTGAAVLAAAGMRHKQHLRQRLP